MTNRNDRVMTPVVYNTKPRSSLSLTPEERQAAAMEDIASQVQQEVRGRIPEHIFRDYFLPVLIDDLKGMEDVSTLFAHREKVLGDWVSVAGSRFLEVDVLSGTGEVLFAVPSLGQQATFSTRRDDHAVPIASLVSMSSMMGAMSPSKGAHHFDTTTERHIKESTNMNKLKHKDTDRWLEICKRYPTIKGVSYMEAERLAALNGQTKEAPPPPDVNDFFDFE